jgi:uncharacterized protein YbaR (Trm112 family)
MHLALTERLICPQCGPPFGLILLAHDVRGRRVLDGDLGCANCQESYPVQGGFADLRPSPREPLPAWPPQEDPPSIEADETLRLGALLGVTEGPGTLLIQGPAAWHSENLVELIGGVEIVSLYGELAGQEEIEGVSRIVAEPRIPFFSDTFRGILLSGVVTEVDLEEAARVVAPSNRMVVLEATPEAREKVAALEFKVLLYEAGNLVAQKEGSGSLPLVTLRGL